MFQINRKEYTHLIDALGELQTALETERETQQLMADGSEDSFKGAAGMAMRAGLTAFLNQGVYEEAYQQSKKMKESMESLLPLVIKLSWEADTLATHLEEDVLTNSFLPYYVLYPHSDTAIFMLDESHANYVEQNCEDLVRRGKFLKTQMQEAIDECAGIIDCSEEQSAINEALKSVLRIEKFQEAFQSYVAGVKMLDESLRMDFLSLVDAEDIECGKALQTVIKNELDTEISATQNVSEQIPKEWELYYENTKTLIEQIDESKWDNRFDYDLYIFKKIYSENKYIYEEISLKTGIPPELIAAFHYRESACDFDTYLHNGEELGTPTTIEPEGRFFDDFSEAAIDALLYVQESKGISLPSNPDVISMMWFAEIYNGIGYTKFQGIASPYVYSGTNVYEAGKYVEDRQFDEKCVDKQPGIYILVNAIINENE